MPLVKNSLCQNLQTEYPFWQAPLPFDMISAEMSGRISAEGSHGILRIAAHDTKASLEQKINIYRQHHLTPSFCFSHRLPQHPRGKEPDYYAAEMLQKRLGVSALTLQQGDHFSELLSLAMNCQPRAIGFSQGIPDIDVFQAIQARGIQTFVICSNMLELLTADDFGCDIFVLQGTEAGGERCTFSNQLTPVIQPALSLLQQARWHTKKPLVLWGDCSDAADIVAAMISGAQSVMLERPFMACPENGLDETSRQRVVASSEFESTITEQYTVRPLRCLQNDFLRQPEALLARSEMLFDAAFKQLPQARPLPISLSPIEDPLNLENFLDRQKQKIKQYLA